MVAYDARGQVVHASPAVETTLPSRCERFWQCRNFENGIVRNAACKQLIEDVSVGVLQASVLRGGKLSEAAPRPHCSPAAQCRALGVEQIARHATALSSRDTPGRRVGSQHRVAIPAERFCDPCPDVDML